MKNKTIKTYKIDELPKEIQEKIINNNLEICLFHGWEKEAYEGIVKRMEKNGYFSIDIKYTGFYSQGDGASFTAKIDIEKWIEKSRLKTRFAKFYNFTLDIVLDDEFQIIRYEESRYFHENTCELIYHYYSDERESTAGKITKEIQRQINDISIILEDERLKLCYSIYKALKHYYEMFTDRDNILTTLKDTDEDYFEDGREV